jgi:hypothetical protein
MVVVDGHHSLGKKEMFQTNLQRETISLKIKVPLMMILLHIAITVGFPIMSPKKKWHIIYVVSCKLMLKA